MVPNGEYHSPLIVYGEASVVSLGGTSLFQADQPVTPNNVENYYSEEGLYRIAIERLRENGFEILNEGRTTISIAAPQQVYEQVFGIELSPNNNGSSTTGCSTLVKNSDDPSLIDAEHSCFANLLEGVALINEVCVEVAWDNFDYPQVSPTPPEVSYNHYLTVPDGLADGLNATAVHKTGYTGSGVNVVVVDTGFYQHPFFQSQGLSVDVLLPPGTSNPTIDEEGHGTFVVANVLAIAPDAHVTVIKSGKLSSIFLFKMAMALNPTIIQNTWGFDVPYGSLYAIERVVECTIADAVKQGIIVVFPAGNLGSGALFPSQMPQVLAVGGVHKREDGLLEASSYASGYMSELYAGRIVPDFCGLVGIQPQGVYIMLPTQPGSLIDKAFAANPYPQGDGTTPTDGWVCISGTSCAAAQISGVCALIKQANPELNPEQVKEVLAATALPVSLGESVQGNSAGAECPNLATGYGLVDAAAAIEEALVRHGSKVSMT